MSGANFFSCKTAARLLCTPGTELIAQHGVAGQLAEQKLKMMLTGHGYSQRIQSEWLVHHHAAPTRS
jgi:hypothetical protein